MGIPGQSQPFWLHAGGLVLAAAIGCDRPSPSQAPPPKPVTMTVEPTAAPAEVEAAPDSNSADLTAEVKPASHQTAAAETPSTAAPANDGPPRPAALRPKADRSATTKGVEKISWDDLILGMQPDIVFRPWMLESETNGGRAKELDGKKVRLSGVMHGGVETIKRNKEFVLLRNKECKFGPGGQADHLAKIFMKDGKTVSFTDDTIFVEGTLKIEAETGDDGNTWSIYRIEGAEVK